MRVTEVEFAQKVRDRVARGWCRRAAARDKYRKPVPYWDPRAVSFCVSGAAMAEKRESSAIYAAMRFQNGFSSWVGGWGIMTWNDHQTSKKYILDTFDAYIRHLKGLQ